VILATHKKDIVDSLRHRVIILDKGRVVSDTAEGTYTLT